MFGAFYRENTDWTCNVKVQTVEKNVNEKSHFSAIFEKKCLDEIRPFLANI
jgi:hypothetical protein